MYGICTFSYVLFRYSRHNSSWRSILENYSVGYGHCKNWIIWKGNENTNLYPQSPTTGVEKQYNEQFGFTCKLILNDALEGKRSTKHPEKYNECKVLVQIYLQIKSDLNLDLTFKLKNEDV